MASSTIGWLGFVAAFAVAALLYIARHHRAMVAGTPWVEPWSASAGGSAIADDPERPRRPLVIGDITSRRPRILRWLAALGVPAGDAPDLAQDVTLGAWEARATYDPGSARLDSWLFSITRNQAGNYRRSAWNRCVDYREAPPESHAHGITHETPEDAAALAQARRRAVALLDRLPPKIAALLMVRDYAGERPRDIAAAVGAPLSTVLLWIQRGRAALDRELRRDDAKASHRAWVAAMWRGAAALREGRRGAGTSAPRAGATKSPRLK